MMKEQIDSKVDRYQSIPNEFSTAGKKDNELIFSQFQTPQYKESQIGNPISSPSTDNNRCQA
jgi:hypothetical protein